MKKKTAVILAGVLAASMMQAGCSGGNEASNEYVTVGGYKGVKVDKVADAEEVTDENVDEYIRAMREQNAKEADRAVKDGDIVTIDYTGKMDGEEFEGGSAEGTQLVIGSDQFIDGFEDSIVGHKAGETFDWDGQFPDPYTPNPDMSGKDVTFTIELNSVKGVPELNDEFVQTVSEKSKDVDSYREEVKGILEENAEAEQKSTLGTEVWQAVLEKTEFKEVPEDEVNKLNEQLIGQYKDWAKMYGMEYEEFISSQINMTVEDFEKQAKKSAEDGIKAKYMAWAIADEEKLTPSADEFEEEFEKMAEDYGYESVDKLKEAVSEEDLKDSIIQTKVQDWLAENCIQVKE